MLVSAKFPSLYCRVIIRVSCLNRRAVLDIGLYTQLRTGRGLKILRESILFLWNKISKEDRRDFSVAVIESCPLPHPAL
jgi:hypothetical protein